MRRSRGMMRWLWALLVVATAAALLDVHFHVYAQKSAVAESDDGVVVGGEMLEPDVATTVVKKTLKITRAKVSATFETTRIAGKGVHSHDGHVPATVEDLEQCHVGGGDAQCAEDPAQAMPMDDQEVESDPVDRENDQPARALPQSEALNAAARHLKELQDQVRVWLPQLKATVDRVVEEIASAWRAPVATWLMFCKEAQAVYDRFFADAVEFLAPIYYRVAEVASDLCAVVSSWVAIVVDQARTIWETHEEVRIVTRHIVSVLLLACLGAVFFSVYALAGTIPDTISTLWTGLADITRAQLKIISVLVTVFVVYHLRELWTFWLLAASIVAFYYWSGHILAKTPTVQRQASRPSGLTFKSQ